MKSLRILVGFFVAFLIASTGLCKSGEVLNDSDFSLLNQTTEQVIVVGQQLELPVSGLQLLCDQNRVVGVTVYSREYKTNRGVMVGDYLSRIIDCYGEPYHSGEREQYKWVTYLYKNTESSFKIHFYFSKESNLVIAFNMNLFTVGAPPNIKLEN